MYEYAAIEGRLEVICGLLGCPCNRELKDSIRKGIKISDRISCLQVLYRSHSVCKDRKTKVDNVFWERLRKWTKNRNVYVHGLYKRPDLFTKRMGEAMNLADEGLKLTRILYNEAKRIRWARDSHPQLMEYEGDRCKGDRCF